MSQELVAEEIFDKRKCQNHEEYLVKWREGSNVYCKWEPKSTLSNFDELLKSFEKKKRILNSVSLDRKRSRLENTGRLSFRGVLEQMEKEKDITKEGPNRKTPKAEISNNKTSSTMASSILGIEDKSPKTKISHVKSSEVVTIDTKSKHPKSNVNALSSAPSHPHRNSALSPAKKSKFSIILDDDSTDYFPINSIPLRNMHQPLTEHQKETIGKVETSIPQLFRENNSNHVQGNLQQNDTQDGIYSLSSSSSSSAFPFPETSPFSVQTSTKTITSITDPIVSTSSSLSVQQSSCNKPMESLSKNMSFNDSGTSAPNTSVSMTPSIEESNSVRRKKIISLTREDSLQGESISLKQSTESLGWFSPSKLSDIDKKKLTS